MHNKLLIIVLMLFSCFIYMTNITKVEAYEVSYKLAENCELDPECDALFGDPNADGTVANYIQGIFNVIKWLGPILCFAFSIIDFVKATANQDKDALAKAAKKTLTRVVLAMLLFFLPGLINTLFELVGWYGTCCIG